MKEKGDKEMKENEKRVKDYQKGSDPFIDEMFTVIDYLYKEAVKEIERSR